MCGTQLGDEVAFGWLHFCVQTPHCFALVSFFFAAKKVGLFWTLSVLLQRLRGSWHVSPLVIESSKQASLGTKPRNYLKLIKIYVYRTINVSVAALLSARLQLIDFQLQHSVGNARAKMNIKNPQHKVLLAFKNAFSELNMAKPQKSLNGPWIHSFPPAHVIAIRKSTHRALKLRHR